MNLARGILRYCADLEPLVTAWLAEEQRAEAATGSRGCSNYRETGSLRS